MKTRRVCPYEHCGWFWDEPELPHELPLLLGISIEEALRIHNDAIEFVIRSHLDTDHEGWTLADVERAALQAQIRAVFEARPT